MSEQHKIAAAKRGAARTAKTIKAVEDAMETITKEMAGNEGIYPHMGGAVSMAELARRAGINEATFYKKDNVALKDKAAKWLEKLKKKETVGRMRVRKTFRERAENWKEKHDDLLSSYVIMELQMQELQAKHEKLQREFDALLNQMRSGATGNVTSILKGQP